MDVMILKTIFINLKDQVPFSHIVSLSIMCIVFMLIYLRGNIKPIKHMFLGKKVKQAFMKIYNTYRTPLFYPKFQSHLMIISTISVYQRLYYIITFSSPALSKQANPQSGHLIYAIHVYGIPT